MERLVGKVDVIRLNACYTLYIENEAGGQPHLVPERKILSSLVLQALAVVTEPSACSAMSQIA